VFMHHNVAPKEWRKYNFEYFSYRYCLWLLFG
jgi:hypothetical protein